MSRAARTLEEEGPMEADLLGSIGMSNRCTVGGSEHSVVVVGDLLRRHRLMVMRGKSRAGREGKRTVLYIISGSWNVTACRGSPSPMSSFLRRTLSRREHPEHPVQTRIHPLGRPSDS